MPAELKRSLTLFDLTMIAIGSSIGSGIFLTPSKVAEALPAPRWMLAAWAIGGFFTLCGALTFAEPGAMMPRAGGMYVYLTEAFGELVGFLHGWVYLLVVVSGSIAALSVAFAQYAAYLVPSVAAAPRTVALTVLAAITLINVLGVRPGAAVIDTLTVAKLLGVAAVIVVGLTMGSRHVTDFGAPLGEVPGGPGKAFAVGLVGVLWSYGGWQHATFAAGEATRPKRDLPLALALGTLAVGVVYVVANVAYLFLLDPTAMARSSQLASSAVGVVLGRAGGTLVALLIVVSVLGTISIYTMTGPRIYHAMAERGLFFRGVATIHPRFHTPAFAIVLQSVWAGVLVLFWGTFQSLISYVIFTDWIFFALTAAAVFVLRRRRPTAERPYKVLGYPWTPIVYLGGCAWFVGSAILAQPREAAAGLGLLALGVPVYFVWARRKARAG